jgi:hypothetical protein
MGAGEPNWLKLYETGKLPDNQRHRIPFLKELDKKNKELEKLKKSEQVSLKCPAEGCEYVANGTQAQAENRLNLHSKSHNKTEE